MKKWLGAALFCLIALALALYLGQVFAPKQLDAVNQECTTLTIIGLYAEPDGTLDVLSLGSSTSRSMLFPKALWEAEGIALYSLATPYQDARLGYHLLCDALRSQTPRLVLVNPSFLFSYSEEKMLAPYVKMISAAMECSPAKWTMQLDYALHDEEYSLQELLFPLLSFHDRLTALTPEDFWGIPRAAHPFKGVSVYLEEYEGQIADAYLESRPGSGELDADGLLYTQKIVDLCRERGIEMLFVAPPKLRGWTLEQHAAAAAYCAQNGVDLLDYNAQTLRLEAGFDPSADYFDPGTHANYSGQLKLSRHLAAYLGKHFDLPDRRGEAAYRAWDDLPEPGHS